METIQLGPQEALYYEYVAPASTVECAYVFFNALTGDSNMWEAVIAPKLREFGHGTLVYNFRGQTNSPFAPGTKLDADLIVDDALRLLQGHIFFDDGDVEALFARLPRAQRFDMPDAGHLIPVERPEASVQALLTFARDLRWPSGTNMHL